MNQVFSLISRDKGEKEKDSSTLNEDEFVRGFLNVVKYLLHK